MMWTDSVDENLETCKELIRGLPSSAQQRAQKVANRLVNIVEAFKKDSPNDPAVALGCAFAAFFIADHFVTQDREAPEKSLIQLVQ